MDQDHLNKYFNTALENDETLSAYTDLRNNGRNLAVVINKLVPESAAKSDLLGRLFRVVVDAELAIRMDGVNRMTPMIVTKQ